MNNSGREAEEEEVIPEEDGEVTPRDMETFID